MRCDSCGVESPLTDSFRELRPSFMRRGIVACPACRGKSADGAPLLSLVVLIFSCLLLAAYGVCRAFSRLQTVDAQWGVLVNTSLFFVFSSVGIWIHELGHAIAAGLVRFEITTIRIGSGRLLHRWMIGQTGLELRLFPNSGGVTSITLNPAAYRIRKIIIVLAGPLAN